MVAPLRRLRVALLAMALTAAGCVSATVATTQSDAAVDYDAYILRAAEAAKASKKAYGVPRAVTIAQSILESGWGKSGLTTKYRNYFGIKCGATASPHQNGCVALPSYEYVNGKKVTYVSRFRTYSSMEKSFLDHGRLLNYLDRYNPAFKYPNDPDNFIKAVHKAGYATDPNYSTLVINLMKRWNLYRFDAVKPAAPKPDPSLALIRSIAPIAQASEAKTGVPASVTIAQALYHSDAGRSTLATKATNYFSVLCSGIAGRTSSGCLRVNGTSYRVYRTMADAVSDQAAILSTGKRYTSAMKVTADYKAFAKAVAKGGWSRNRGYADKLLALVAKYQLAAYDLSISRTLAKGAKGVGVVALQNLLTASGQRVKATGYFGTDTVAAVKAFQKRATLSASGKADPLTLTRLTPDLRQSATGARVVALHALLKAKGYTVSGHTFSASTTKAVKALQKKRTLPRTGIVSTRTWGVLFG